jgi:hypothetical protein
LCALRFHHFDEVRAIALGDALGFLLRRHNEFSAFQIPWWSALVPATQFFIVYLIVAWLERRRSRAAAALA